METHQCITRTSSSDTERVRLLKEVLRSSAHAAATNRPGSWKARLEQIGETASRRGARRRRAPPLEELCREGEAAELLAATSAPDLAPLLLEGGRRIRSLCTALSPEPRSPAALASPAAGAAARSPVGGGKPAARRAELERAAARAVERWATFPRLDELEAAIQGAQDAEGLRAAELAPGRPAFPLRRRQHAAMALLTDHALQRRLAPLQGAPREVSWQLRLHRGHSTPVLP